MSAETGQQRRAFFRVRTPARVSLRVLAPEEVESARVRIGSRGHLNAFAAGDESRPPGETHAILTLLQQVISALDRLTRRVDALAEQAAGGRIRHGLAAETVSISLSGSGLAGEFDHELETADVVELELDLPESGLPIIPAIARIVRAQRDGKKSLAALNFEELAPEDRERIVRFCIQSQRRELAARRSEREPSPFAARAAGDKDEHA